MPYISDLSDGAKDVNNSSTDARPSAGPQEEGPSRSDRLRIKNRRMRFLDLHPEYFSQAELELEDPLLYDRFVRHFQTATEREQRHRARAAGSTTNYTGDLLEANLVRSEAKIEALHHPDPNSPVVYQRAADGTIVSFEQDEDDRALSKEDGWARWTDIMGQRFLRGEDRHFDYATVDENEDYDDRQEEDRERLEEYLDDEEVVFPAGYVPSGETGVQDF